jgi:hypothetical protein
VPVRYNEKKGYVNRDKDENIFCSFQGFFTLSLPADAHIPMEHFLGKPSSFGAKSCDMTSDR